MTRGHGAIPKTVTRRRLLAASAIGGVAMASLAACSGKADGAGSDAGADVANTLTQSTAEPKRGGLVRANMGAQNVFLDPHMTALPGVSWLWGNVSHHLVEVNADREITDEGLAASWETPDALTLTFTLPDGITFHVVAPASGRAMTVEDVIYSIERIRTPDPQFARRSLFEAIDNSSMPTWRFRTCCCC